MILCLIIFKISKDVISYNQLALDKQSRLFLICASGWEVEGFQLKIIQSHSCTVY